MGSRENPDGSITTAYRTARLALQTVLSDTGETARLEGARDVMTGLRSAVLSDLRPTLRGVQKFGRAEARRQLDFYREHKAGNLSEAAQDRLDQNYQAVVSVIRSRLDEQERSLNALILLGEDALILPDDGNLPSKSPGVLKDSIITTAAAFYISSLLWDAFSLEVDRSPTKIQFLKQAVVILDKRTTECCIKVHGQVQELDEDFLTTGSPAFSDRQDYPPFHYRCRTSIALYDATYDNGFTEAMQREAAALLLEDARIG